MNPIILAITRGLVGLIVCLALISTLAGLSGCNVTRATAAAPPPAPTLQPVDCRHWQDCA